MRFILRPHNILSVCYVTLSLICYTTIFDHTTFTRVSNDMIFS